MLPLSPHVPVDDLEKHDPDKVADGGGYLSQEHVEKLNHSRGGGSTVTKDNLRKGGGGTGLLSDEKLHSIMSYLDEVDMAERLSEMDQVCHCVIYCGPCNLRPLYLTIPSVLRPGFFDTHLILSI